MKLAFTTLACPKWELPKILETAVANRYDAIDFRGYLDHVELPDSPAFRGDGLKETAARVADSGLAVSCLSSGARALAVTPEEKAKSQAAMRAYAELCPAFRCRTVRVFCGTCGGKPAAEMVPVLAECLAEAAAIARAYDVEFLAETHDEWTDSALLRKAYDLAGAPEGLSILWDIHHPYRFADETPTVTAAHLKGTVKGVHWKDSVATPDGRHTLRLMGEGDLPLFGLYNALRSTGFDGYHTFEWEKRWHPDIEEPEVAVPQFAEFMRALEGRR